MKSSRVLDVRQNATRHAARQAARQTLLKRRFGVGALVVASVCGGALWSQRPIAVSHAKPIATNSAQVQSALVQSAPTQTVSTPIAAIPNAASENAASQNVAEKVADDTAKRLEYEVVGVHPHDAAAFTQGLVWHNGGFYESTGLNGRSTLRRVAFPSGRVLAKRDIPSQYFAEGLAMAGDKLVQITWKNGEAFVYNRATLKLLKTWNYSGEGWGLAFNGTHFVMSDGSATLAFRDAETFKTLRRVAVTMNGEPLTQLNELEVIDGKVWANVWRTDFIVQIDPQNGRVVSYLDLSNLHPRSGNEDVLNGIAYDQTRKRLFITGKLWPKLYQIKVVK